MPKSQDSEFNSKTNQDSNSGLITLYKINV